MRPALRWAIGSAAVILWLALIVTAYYVVHKPFGPSNASALLTTAIDLASAGAIALLATALGRRVLGSTEFPSQLERLIFSAGLGLGIASLVMLGLAWIGLPDRSWGLLGAAVLTILLRREIRGLLSSLRRLRLPRASDRVAKFLVAYVLLSLGFALVLALLPPTAWDSLLYHLPGPFLLVQGASYSQVLRITPLASSSVLDHLFLAGLWLRGDGVAAPLHWLYAVLTLGSIWQLASRLDPTHRWLAVSLLLSGFTWVVLAGWPYVDWGLAFYGTAGFLALHRWRQGQIRQGLFISAAMVGLGLGVKYTGVIVAVPLGTLLLLDQRRADRRVLARDLATFGSVALLFVAPFLLRNWAFAGNPVYPLFGGGLDWDSYRQWRFARPGSGLAENPLALVLAPLEATLLGSEGKVGYQATIGPLFLGLIPLALIAVVRDHPSRPSRLAGLAVAIMYVVWLAGLASSSFFQRVRLVLPMFPLLAYLAAAGVDHVRSWDRRGFSLNWILRVLIVMVLTLNLASFALYLQDSDPWAYLLGEQTRDEYLADHLGSYYDAMTYLNRELPPPARVQFLWEPRSYYCDVDCQPDVTLDRFSDLVFRHQELGAIVEQLQEDAATHLLLFEAGIEYMAETDPAALPSAELTKLRVLLADHFEPVRSFGAEYTLFAWK